MLFYSQSFTLSISVTCQRRRWLGTTADPVHPHSVTACTRLPRPSPSFFICCCRCGVGGAWQSKAWISESWLRWLRAWSTGARALVGCALNGLLDDTAAPVTKWNHQRDSWGCNNYRSYSQPLPNRPGAAMPKRDQVCFLLQFTRLPNTSMLAHQVPQKWLQKKTNHRAPSRSDVENKFRKGLAQAG